jgi:hypothetical protein
LGITQDLIFLKRNQTSGVLIPFEEYCPSLDSL